MDTEGTNRISGDANYVNATQSGCVCIFDAVQLLFSPYLAKLGQVTESDVHNMMLIGILV